MQNLISKVIITFLLAFSTLPSFAQLEAGKVYRFNNVGKPGNVLALSGAVQGAVGAASNTADLKQQWYVTRSNDGSGYYFRNVSNGAYLGSPKQLYTQWPVTFTTSPDDASMALTIDNYNGNIVIRSTKQGADGYVYAHNDSGNSIVCWLKTSDPTQWKVEEVALSESQLAEILNRFANTGDEIANASKYEGYLDNLFTDKACTTLRTGADLSSSNSNFASLPVTLQNMATKIKNASWTEQDGDIDWDHKYALKYRVQDYEPYSEGATGASFVGIQAYTNMNNPTGIYANAGEIIYVMVDQDVPAGATLYIGGVPDCSMYNSVTSGTPLKKGLNMILSNADLTHFFIYYTANTIENKTAKRKLSEFPPITIHIEGGHINGFFNYIGDSRYTPDTKTDFDYTTQRAKHPMFDLIGKYVILHFYLEDTPDLPGGTPAICVKNAFSSKNTNKKHDDPVKTMVAWDNMCFAERILMGLQSDEDIAKEYNEGLYESIVNESYNKGGYQAPTIHYSDYFNNRMMGINYQAAGLYMNATSWRTAYAPSTVSAILSQFPEDGIWGPAHEYGHMNQGPISIAGTTEESNNVFSNVANYFVCKTTSRADYPSEQLKNFSAGNTYLQNETWGTTRMFWQLWCYYHLAGHNKKFYPRLFELLRKNPLVRETTTYPGKLNARKDMLHFAKMACIAAGEDLTNFFASWGFFSPQDTYHIDDYSIYELIVTPEDIAAVKQEIADLGFIKNDAIILIDDRPGSSLPTGFGYNKDLCGKYGGIDSFKNGDAPQGNFEFTVDGNHVTVSGGNPGVGYLIYDEDGNLIGFSNSDSFTLSSEAAQALVDGKASVKAVGADNQTIEAIDPVRDGSPDRKKDLLKQLVARSDELLARADESLTRVGDIIPSYSIELKELRDEINSTLENSDSETLTNDYLRLSNAYYALLNNPEARIGIEPGASYRLINRNYTSKTLDAGESKLVSSAFNASSKAVPFSQQWILEPVGDGSNTQFYIRNLGDGRYISTSKKQSSPIPLSESPQAYSFITITPGVYSFAPDNEVKFGIHIDAGNNVVQWNTTALATQWSLIKICSATQIALRNQMTEKMMEAENLLSTCGTIERSEPKDYVFSDSHLYSNAPYKGNNSDGFKTWNVLFDNNLSTYFHSDYSGNNSEDGLDHYIRMEAPDKGNFRFLNLSYTTRQNDNTNTNPKSVIIEASPDKENWREVYHASGLKTGNAVKVETGEIFVPEDTRFIRFMVPTASSDLKGGHSYFVISALNVSDLGEPIFTPDEGFPYLKSEDMRALYDDIINAKLDLAYSATDAETLQSRIKLLETASSTLSSLMVPEVDVTSLEFSVNPIVMKMGDDDLVVTATVEPEDATFPEFIWDIDDNKVAEIVSTDGKSALIRPLAIGLANLTISVVGNPMVNAVAALKILPQIPVESVTLTPSELSVPLNAGILTINASIYPENATVKSLCWTSSDESVIEIDEISGEMTLLRQGVAEISAMSTDGTELAGKCVVSVSNPVAQGLLLYPSELSMEEGEQIRINATYIPEEAQQPILIWSSSNEAVASVDPSGLVTAMSPGNARIDVNSEVNGKELAASAYITVNPLTLKAITLSPLNMTLEKGSEANIVATLSPENVETDLIWSVDNQNIASIEVSNDKKSAKVKAVNSGMTLVTVGDARYPDLKASCHISVPETAVTGIKLEMTETSFNVSDGKQRIKASISPADAPTPRLVWDSSDEKVATLQSVAPTECELTPLDEGQITLTVIHADRPEIYDSKQVTITETSGIARLFDDKESPVDVYSLAGQIVMKNADLHKLDNLSPGIYIIKQGDLSKEVLIK
ncbi:MAG: Ig-like domain-containing protein [Muribaculaceae bacterium]|nr:Ig-like domain-containing protein [Muribaculaceae bacterium]